MTQLHCKTCKYYIQHYGLNKHGLFEVCFGHCAHRRAKSCRPGTIACGSYLPGIDPRDSFVTKEYLSKELLQYILNLELLPEISKLLLNDEYIDSG